jgi:CBS domain-containing protein
LTARIDEDIAVGDLMTKDVITCPPDAGLGGIASILAGRRVHAVFVVNEAGLPAGVVSDFDLLAGEWLADDEVSLRTMQSITAGELMTSPVETIRSDTPAGVAAARMRELRLSRLLVVNGEGAPVGVVSVSDLVAPLGRQSGARRRVGEVMSHAIVTCPLGTPLWAAARAMTERRSRSIVVVDDKGRAAGVLTGNDLLSLYGAPDRSGVVEDLMSTPITCDPDLPLRDAADLMISNEVHRLVVVDSSVAHGEPIGIVSTSDIVAEMADERSVWQRKPT